MSTASWTTRLAVAVSLLDRAAHECAARGATASGILDDLSTWHVDALLVSLAAETLRGAVGTELSEPTDVDAAAGGDPLELVSAARDQFEEVTDQLDNQPLLLGRLRTSQALAAVRTHYE
jgi:hypothetical protein